MEARPRLLPYSDAMAQKRLERSMRDKWLGGVAGGLADYFGIDSTIVRLVFIVAFFGFGTGLLIYLVLWLVMPPGSPV